jgi:hypothetical protein
MPGVRLGDRRNYEKLARKNADSVCWLDITGRDEELRALGIDPRKALTELHVRDEGNKVHSELDAYILLLRRVPLLKPWRGWSACPPQPFLARHYRRGVAQTVGAKRAAIVRAFSLTRKPDTLGVAENGGFFPMRGLGPASRIGIGLFYQSVTERHHFKIRQGQRKPPCLALPAPGVFPGATVAGMPKTL